MTRQNPPAGALLPSSSGKDSGKAPSLLVPMFRIPVFLYRIGLGWLLGGRFMQVTHIGRRSGKARRTVLAVLHFDRQTREIHVVSAWKGSDWFRNIQAAPALQVESGFVRYVPAQRILAPEEIAAALAEFRQKYPIFSRMVCRIPGWKWDSSDAEFLELARTLHGVSFRPKESG